MAVFALDKPHHSHKMTATGHTIQLTNTKLYAGRTYYVRVIFRTRGDGESTASKCSSVGFIAHWDSWAQSRSYIHASSTAYNERKAVVSWTYSFTVGSDVQPTGTALYFIINNGWSNGYDSQTIDLYYAKYWDSAGNVYNELGEECYTLNIRQQGAVYPAPFASTAKYSTPSLCFRRQGKTCYIPLLPPPEQSASSGLDIGAIGEYKYYVKYSVHSYIMPQMSIRHGGRTYHVPNECIITQKPTCDIPAGTYTAQSLTSRIEALFGSMNSTPMSYTARTLKNEVVIKIGSQPSVTVPAGRTVYMRNIGGASPFQMQQLDFSGTSRGSWINSATTLVVYVMCANQPYAGGWKNTTITFDRDVYFN